MECVKCKFDLGDTPPNYCPNCGKKVKIDPPKKGLKNLDYLNYITADEFSEIWKTLKKKGSDEAFSWFFDTHEDIPVFTIYLFYRYYYESSRKNWSTRREHRADYNAVRRAFADPNNCEIKVEIVEKPLSTQMGMNSLNKNWWRTKEGAQEVLDEGRRVGSLQRKEKEERKERECGEFTWFDTNGEG